jgi:hypothetical protein
MPLSAKMLNVNMMIGSGVPATGAKSQSAYGHEIGGRGLNEHGRGIPPAVGGRNAITVIF